MKQLVLNVEESKFKSFLSYLRTLDYVSISDDQKVPQWQQDEVAHRLARIDKGDMQTRDWEEARKDIFRK